MTATKGIYVPRRPAPDNGGVTTPTVDEVGICRGCSREKRLRADGRVRDHMLPLEMRRAGHAEPCPGGGVLPEGGQAVTPPPVVVVKVAVEKPTDRGQCRICGHLKPLAGDGRVRAHLDSSRLLCDGAGRLPARGAS